jgi:broad specificity phosphatase PhoE
MPNIKEYQAFTKFGNIKILSWTEIYEQLQNNLALPKTIELHLIRHAETETNADKLITGSQDVKLNSKGKEQAVYLGRKLDKHYNIAFSSEMDRSQKTLEIALKEGKVNLDNLFVDKRLNERSLGVLEGQRSRWIPENEAGDLNYAPPEGESYLEVAQRTLSFLRDLAEFVSDNDINKVLICGHMGPLRIMVGIIEEQENPVSVLGLSFRNAEVYKLAWNRLTIPKFIQGVDERRSS